MLIFILRRIITMIPVVFGIPLAVMLVVSATKGDPAQILLGEAATTEALAALRQELGLNRPLPEQYLMYLGKLSRGDMGRSFRSRRPVAVEIKETLPATLALAGAALVISLVLGVPAGIISASRPNSFWDHSFMVVSLIGLSMPVFWTGLLLVLVFSHYLHWFPTGGYGEWQHLVLPGLTLGSTTAANFSRMVRSSLLDALSQDYVRTARAKGLPEARVVLRHALKNASIPVVTVIGLQTGVLLGGAIITETVFAWPGIGRKMVEAVLSRDILLLQGSVLVLALSFVLINLAVDLSYSYLDPRIKYS